jgi:hypothetical protein
MASSPPAGQPGRQREEFSLLRGRAKRELLPLLPRSRLRRLLPGERCTFLLRARPRTRPLAGQACGWGRARAPRSASRNGRTCFATSCTSKPCSLKFTLKLARRRSFAPNGSTRRSLGSLAPAGRSPGRSVLVEKAIDSSGRSTGSPIRNPSPGVRGLTPPGGVRSSCRSRGCRHFLPWGKKSRLWERGRGKEAFLKHVLSTPRVSSSPRGGRRANPGLSRFLCPRGGSPGSSLDSGGRMAIADSDGHRRLGGHHRLGHEGGHRLLGAAGGASDCLRKSVTVTTSGAGGSSPPRA